MEANPIDDESRAAHEVLLQTCLEVGIRTQMSGGYTARVRNSMQRVALAYGAEQAETWVSSGSIGIAVKMGGWTRTSVRTTPAIGVNFTELSQLSQLAKSADKLSLTEFRTRLEIIESQARNYPQWLVLLMLGVSCASFAALFGADTVGIVTAGIGGFLGSFVRTQMLHQRFKPFIYSFFAALVAASVVLAAQSYISHVQQAVTASILFLVPGVPLLNGTADLLTSNYLNGVVRLTRASVILMGATLGLAFALMLWRFI